MLEKSAQRRLAYDARRLQPNKSILSQQICEKLINLPEYQTASVVMWYVDCRSEVRTRQNLTSILQSDKKIVAPYCTQDEFSKPKLGLWLLQDMNELRPGKWDILEPPKQRWQETGKQIQVEQLDLIVVPGVGFDRQGGRLGNGAGYYDRLLAKVRKDALLVGIAFESQLLESITMDEHDIFMDKVITETEIYSGKGR